MTPQLVHRYVFPIREAIEALLGDAVGDCEAWRIRIEGDEVVIDVIAPAPGIAPTMAEVTSLDDHPRDAKSIASHESGEVRDKQQDPEPELKGGALARRAGITCSERGFWTFLGVSSADEAKADVCRRCGITTRKMLDHDERAAAIWDDIIGKYRLWLEGHDVELE